MTRLIDALGPGLAATVNALRIERDVSRKAFAAALGLSLGGIDDRLAGRQPFTLLDVAVIADLFNVSIDYLVRTSRHD
jgi:transcriptional regulator with XRE-family HTH domain